MGKSGAPGGGVSADDIPSGSVIDSSLLRVGASCSPVMSVSGATVASGTGVSVTGEVGITGSRRSSTCPTKIDDGSARPLNCTKYNPILPRQVPWRAGELEWQAVFPNVVER